MIMGIESYTRKQQQAEEQIEVKNIDVAPRTRSGQGTRSEKGGSDWRKTSTPWQQPEPLKSLSKGPFSQYDTSEHHLGFGIDKIRPPSDMTAHEKTERKPFQRDVAIDKILSQKYWR